MTFCDNPAKCRNEGGKEKQPQATLLFVHISLLTHFFSTLLSTHLFKIYTEQKNTLNFVT